MTACLFKCWFWGLWMLSAGDLKTETLYKQPKVMQLNSFHIFLVLYNNNLYFRSAFLESERGCESYGTFYSSHSKFAQNFAVETSQTLIMEDTNFGSQEIDQIKIFNSSSEFNKKIGFMDFIFFSKVYFLW